MSNRGDPAWVVWLSLAGLIAAFAAGVAALSLGIANIQAERAAGDEDDKAIMADPDTGEVAKAMRANFPDEYSMLKITILTARRSDETPEEINARIDQFTWTAVSRHAEEVAQAPHEQLAAYRTAEQRLLERFGTLDPADCAEYVIRGTTSYAIEDAEAKKLKTAAGVAFWNAAGAGAKEPAGRDIGMLSDEDFNAYNAAMLAAGVAKADLDAIDRLGEMTEVKQCDIGMKRMRAIGQLPPETGDRVYGALLTGSN